jgi:hypothetical protein
MEVGSLAPLAAKLGRGTAQAGNTYVICRLTSARIRIIHRPSRRETTPHYLLLVPCLGTQRDYYILSNGRQEDKRIVAG